MKQHQPTKPATLGWVGSDMTKAELVKYLEPFMDETKILIRSEGLRRFFLEYQPTGTGVNQDEAAVIIVPRYT